MKDKNLSKIRQLFDEEDEKLSKIRRVFKDIGSALVVFGGVAVMLLLFDLGVGFVWPLVAPVFAAGFYLLAPRASRLARLVKPLFPAANELINRQEQVNSNITVVERMGYTLRFYEIYSTDEDQPLYESLVNSLPDVNDDNARIKNCARNVSGKLKYSDIDRSALLLELLYRERHSSKIQGLWEKEKERLVHELAETLRKKFEKSGRDKVSYGQGDLQRLLLALEDYDYEDVLAQVGGVNDIHRRVGDYLKFLTDNGVEHRITLGGAGSILEYIERESLPFKPGELDPVTRKVLGAVGEKALREAFPALGDDLLSAFCLVCLALFLEEGSGMQASVCKEAAKSAEAVYITFAFLEFKEDLRIEGRLDGKNFVSVRYLVLNWKSRVREREKDLKGFQYEIDQITVTLGRGEWVTSLWYMLEETYKKIRQDSRIIREIHAMVAERPFIKESLRRVFRTLTIETVERYLETRKINAYLLTFMSDEGTVSDLLNSIIAPDMEGTFESLKIPLQANGLPKYNYKQYTRNARIGVVPKGWSFDMFYRTFQEDFEKVIDYRETILRAYAARAQRKKKQSQPLPTPNVNLKDIELIIHRFGLSGRNYYGLVSKFTRAHAIEKIKELFSGILSTEDLEAVIKYEKDDRGLLNAIMEGPISELISDRVTLRDDERKVFEPREESVRTGILAALGYYSAADLGHKLRSDGGLAAATDTAACRMCDLLAGTVPEFSRDRCRVIAEAYLETLTAVASIGA